MCGPGVNRERVRLLLVDDHDFVGGATPVGSPGGKCTAR